MAAIFFLFWSRNWCSVCGMYGTFLPIIFQMITAGFQAVVDIETKTFIHCGAGLGNADKFFRPAPNDFPRNQMCKPSIADGFSLLQLKEISQIHSASWNNKCKFNARDHWRFCNSFFHCSKIHLASIWPKQIFRLPMNCYKENAL